MYVFFKSRVLRKCIVADVAWRLGWQMILLIAILSKMAKYSSILFINFSYKLRFCFKKNTIFADHNVIGEFFWQKIMNLHTQIHET